MASYILHRITSSTMSVPQQKKWISYPIKQCELSKWITLKWHFYECSSISNFREEIKRKGSNFAVCEYICLQHTLAVFYHYLLYCITGCIIVVTWSPKSQVDSSFHCCDCQQRASFVPYISWFLYSFMVHSTCLLAVCFLCVCVCACAPSRA